MTVQSPNLRRLGRRQRLYEAVQEELKRYIAENGLRPGNPLPSESELARQLGVGRNSVREAVKSIEALGILEVRVGSGLFVKELDFDPVLNYLAYATLLDLKRLADVRDIRRYLELGLADRLIERATDSQLAAMRDVLAKWRPIAATGRYESEFDKAFHEACWQRLDNELMSQILETFWEVQDQARERASIPDPADPGAHFELHEGIYEAIAANDPERLRRAITLHYAGIQARADRGVPHRGRRKHAGAGATRGPAPTP